MTTEQIGVPQPPEPHERQRRIAVVPIAIAVGVLLLAAVFAIVVVGLAGSAPVAAPAPTPSASAGIPEPAPAAPAPEPTPAARPAAGPNECVDARGDGTSIDLDSVALSVEGDRLRVVFVLAEPLPDGASSLEVYAEGQDVRYQLATVWDDGDLDEFFAYRLPDSATHDDDDDDDADDNRPNHWGPRDDDDRDGDRTDLKKRDISNEGTVVIADFPSKVLDRLGDEFLWYAYATAGHDPADSCYLADGSLVPFVR